LFFGCWILIETILFGKDVPGYPSLVVSVMVIGGVQLLMIGVLGEYVGKMLSEIKGRPVYFVAEHSMRSANETAKARPAASRAAE
jgi:polyisoprenyl-phosphate glycosyltransferase